MSEKPDVEKLAAMALYKKALEQNGDSNKSAALKAVLALSTMDVDDFTAATARLSGWPVSEIIRMRKQVIKEAGY